MGITKKKRVIPIKTLIAMHVIHGTPIMHDLSNPFMNSNK